MNKNDRRVISVSTHTKITKQWYFHFFYSQYPTSKVEIRIERENLLCVHGARELTERDF